jgi:6-pyruvoyltetrahydropterin/6-carboxytetrahydropterin synthase
MYTLAIRRDFIARHYLIGGDWGPENSPNSHHYVLEVRLESPELDEHGYLVDIVEVEEAMGELVSHYAERMLNDLPEFKGLNPSLENFARIFAMAIKQRITAKNLTRIEVVLWENDSAWAAYATDRPPAE